MQDVLSAAKNLGCVYNVTARVYDRGTGRLVSEHIGHNQATCSMMLGIAHYLQGDGILNQAPGMLSKNIPMYMSLGTMGLISQTADADGLPTGIGIYDDPEKTEEEQFVGYMEQLPGFGADGYDANENNDRPYFGLGPMYESGDAVNCELISSKFVRTPITYRAILPEAQAELPETIDIVFSAMISTGALAQFRNGSDHVFITELGLWSNKQWSDSVENGLLAGYRIIPSNSENWDMTVQSNRDILKRSILRVGKNQVVQVIWKIQLGSIEQFGGYVEAYRKLLEESKKSSGGNMTGQLTAYLGGTLTSISGSALELGFVYTGTAASFAQFTVPKSGQFKLMAIAVNSEASTFALNFAVQINGNAVEPETVAYNEYSGSGTNRRNHRVVSYSANFSEGDIVKIDLTERSGYTSFVYALLDGTYPFGSLVQTITTADATASGSYSADAVALYGIFNSSVGGMIRIADVAAGTTVTTMDPGRDYKSAYIFWFEKEGS